MATQLQIRRGTAAQVAAFTGAEGEIVYNSTNDSLHTNDGATAGGFELARADLNNVSDADLNAALTGNTLSALTITTLTATGGTINGTVIGGSTAAALSATTGSFSSTLGVTGAATFSSTVSGAFNGTLGATAPAAVTTTALVATTADINAGTIDGTVIGGSTAAAGSFTTGTFSNGLVLSGNVPNILGGATGGGVSLSNSGISSYVLVYGATNPTYPDTIQITAGAGNYRFSPTAATFSGNVNSTAAGENLFSNVGNVSLAVQSNATDKISIGVEQGVGGTFVASGGALKFRVGGYTAAFDKAQIDASGNLLVGTTDTAPGAGDTNTGVSIRGAGDNRSFFSVNGDYAMSLNRNTSDGAIIQFAKNGTGVGSIGAQGGVPYISGPLAGGLKFSYYDSLYGLIFPVTTTGATADGLHDLGYAGARFRNLFLSGGLVSQGGAIFSGNVGIGLNNGNHRLQVLNDKANFAVSKFTSTSAATTEYGISLNLTNDPNDATRYFLYCSGGVSGRAVIYSNGNIANTNNSYTGISDLKLKENIVDAGSQWDDIKALRVRKYSFKEENAAQPTQIGVIAQEVEAAGMAGLVYESPDQVTVEDGTIGDTGEVTKTVKYSILYMKSVKALQEAMERIESLEARIETLEGA